jgi:hypothetical protein
MPLMKNRRQDQFQLIPEAEMPFNLSGENLPPEPPPQDEPTLETTANLNL